MTWIFSAPSVIGSAGRSVAANHLSALGEMTLLSFERSVEDADAEASDE